MSAPLSRQLVLEAADPSARDRDLVGGKAANLARLAAIGQPVPPWFAISTIAFRSALEKGGLNERIRARVAQLARDWDSRAASADLQSWVRAAELPADLAAAIERAHRETFPDDGLAAVHSSAAGEDAAGESFAGMHESFLFVRTLPQVFAAVRGVWASAFSERALAYRLNRGLSLEIAVGVVVQRMIDARTSGVMFTANPNQGSVHEIVISSLWGAGEGLVSAGLDADTYVVDKETLTAEAALAEKSERVVLDREAGRGVRREAVPAAERAAASLGEEQVRELVRRGLEVERRFGRPQDIEFAVDETGRVLLLQARPITTVEELGPAAGNRLLWDNSNIIESYSGVTTPMTFSFIRRAYAIVYHCFAEVMGIPPRRVREHGEVFENMLGLLRGQVYYNLLNWYRLVRLFPGYDYNRAFMESMMGVKEPARLEEDVKTATRSAWRRYFVELPALLRLVARSAWNFLRIRSIVGRFEKRFGDLYSRWSAIDFRALAPHESEALYREMEERLLRQWKAPIINDFFVMVFYGTLKRLCVSWCGDEAGSLQNDLLCGEGGIESTAPTKMLLELAAFARRHPELARQILERPPEELAAAIPADPRFAEFAAGIARFLELYGLRCMNELKLEERSLRDDPAFLYRVLANYLRSPDPSALDVSAMEARERRIRREAEERAFARLGAWQRPIFRWVLLRARLGVKNRENLRFARTRIYGLLRELLRAVGERFAAAGILDAADDVFYLALEELWAYVRGAAVTTDLKALVHLRRREFDAYRSEADRMPDDRFATFGIPYHRNRFRGRRPPAAASSGGPLRGIGCAPGQVTGPAKVVRSPADDVRLDGEILVAERTDPGWVPLYPSASGLLIERGSILSHSAIVAREMGLPTIVGIPGLLASIRSGQRVRMDGAAGTVEILEGDEGPS